MYRRVQAETRCELTGTGGGAAARMEVLSEEARCC